MAETDYVTISDMFTEIIFIYLIVQFTGVRVEYTVTLFWKTLVQCFYQTTLTFCIGKKNIYAHHKILYD